MATLEQILGGRNLTGVIQATRSGIPILIPEGFLTPTRRVSGNTATYKKVNGNRELARIVQYGSPAQTRGLSGISEIPVTLLHTFENQGFKMDVMVNLMQPEGSDRQQLGMSEVARQTADFKRMFVSLRIAAVTQALMKGVLYFDKNGHLLPSSSGALFSIDYGIPSGNKGQLDWDGAGAIIDASWATASTNIPKHIEKILDAALHLTGYPIQTAIYGRNILSYLLANNYVSQMLVNNGPLQTALQNNQIPNGFLGIPEWRRGGGAFWVDKDGAVQRPCGDDEIKFYPAPSPDWWDFIEGSIIIPENMSAQTPDAPSMLDNVMEAFGMFSYAKMKDNPVTIDQFAGDTFLPVLKVPQAVFLADVTP